MAIGDGCCGVERSGNDLEGAEDAGAPDMFAYTTETLVAASKKE